MIIINLTPHAIVLLGPEGPEGPAPLAEFPPSGQVARCEMVSEPASPATIWATVPADGSEVLVRVAETRLTDLAGLPAPADGVRYIVSAIVAGHPAAAGRTDLLVPAEQIRYPADWPVEAQRGQVRGCRSFSRPA